MTPLPDSRRRAKTWIVIGLVTVLAVVATLLTVNLLSNLPTATAPSPNASPGASEPSGTPLPSSASSTPDASTAPAWTATGSMTEARANGPTATLLADGTVLVAGGDGSTRQLSSAEVYDPSTGSWTATGSMIEARSQYTATLLPDGKVLVAGGCCNGLGELASAELYDPVSGSWTATGSMIEARYVHTATLLPDGKVLVAGGAAIFTDGHVSGPDPLASAELYDPSTGSWTVTASMNEVRFLHTATLLRDGTVLVTGGEGSFGKGDPASAELYDPRNGSWTVTESLHTARVNHTATLLPDGTVLVAGGSGTLPSGATGLLASAELYDPRSGTWTATGNMNEARDIHTATLLPDGTVLVVGGSSGSSVIDLPTSAELFDPGSGSWTATESMIEARDNPMATLLPDGTVLVAGGFEKACTPNPPCTDTIDPLASAELYDPRSGT